MNITLCDMPILGNLWIIHPPIQYCLYFPIPINTCSNSSTHPNTWADGNKREPSSDFITRNLILHLITRFQLLQSILLLFIMQLCVICPRTEDLQYLIDCWELEAVLLILIHRRSAWRPTSLLVTTLSRLQSYLMQVDHVMQVNSHANTYKTWKHEA